MANRKYTVKGSSVDHEFIHVDLLPQMRRPRQFNVNILLIILIGVVLSWLILFIPLSNRQETLNKALERENDLRHQYELVLEEIRGYRIDDVRVAYYANVNSVHEIQNDFFAYMDMLQPVINDFADIRAVQYSGVTLHFDFQLSAFSHEAFTLLQFFLEEHEIVKSVTPGTIFTGEAGRLRMSMRIEVHPNAK